MDSLWKKWLIFFLSKLSPFLDLYPFKRIKNNISARYLEKIWPRSLKLGQLIDDDEWITGLTCEQIWSIFSELWPFEKLDILNLSARYPENYFRPVWSESSLSAWRKLRSLATNWAHSKDSDQTGWMPRLIWVLAGHTATLLGFVTRWLNFEKKKKKKKKKKPLIFSGVMVLWKSGIFELVSKIFKKLFKLGTWSANWGWWVDYLSNF